MKLMDPLELYGDNFVAVFQGFPFLYFFFRMLKKIVKVDSQSQWSQVYGNPISPLSLYK